MLDVLRGWLFPAVCIGCDRPGSALCDRCAPAGCEQERFHIGGVPAFALGSYEGTLRRAVVALKHGQRDVLDAFADLLAERAPLEGTLVPLPTTRARAAQRGFDQSIELARRISVRRGMPCEQLLEKRGGAQAGRSRRERLAARSAFRLRGTLRPPSVTLVDDVCTTGATAADALESLAGAGVRVHGLVFVARTPPDRSRTHAA